jgi:hypothetical protein
VAESLGGYIAAPTNRAWEPVFNQTLYRQALSAEHGLDAYVAVHCALEDGLELDLFEAYAANARDPVVRALLERVVADKRRHASFGWLYLESRARGLSDDAKREIERTAGAWLRDVAAAGYHVPSLATAIDGSPEREALKRTAEAGLGAVTAETEEALLQAYLARARARMAELGLALPPLAHSRLGTL